MLILTFVLLTSGINAQNNQIRSYTLEEGLPQSQVFDIVQDELGFLWIGTQGGGLSSFDGTEFKVWNEKDGLLSNFIQTLSFIDDRLFIGTKDGLSIKNKLHFINYKGPQINTIFQSFEGVILGANGGLFKIDKEGLTRVDIPGFNTYTQVNEIVFDGEWYWVATNKGLWRMSSVTKAPEEITNVFSGNFKSVVSYQKKIFAAAFLKGVYVFDKGSGIPKKIANNKRINSLAIIDNNELWIATDNKGITTVDLQNYNQIRKINRTNGLSVNHIRKCIKDKQSNIWIASSGGGMYRYYQNDFKHHNKDNGLKGNRVYAVHEYQDYIWASNSERGLVKIDTLGFKETFQDTSFLDVKIKTISNDYFGNLWFGTDGKGIYKLRQTPRDSIVFDTIINVPVSDTLTVYDTKIEQISEKEGLPSNWIRKVLPKNKEIWAATYSSGIVKINPARKGLPLIKLYAEEEGLEDMLINDMKFDEDGKLWYSTKSGSLGYIFNNQVNHHKNVLDRNIAITSILFDREHVFIGTSGKGVWWSDKSTLKFEKLSGNKALYSENVYQMIFDNQHHLWVGSESGVDKITLNSKNEMIDVVHFGRNNGFLGIETCLNAIEKDKKGNIWFGAIYGLTKYEPNTEVKTFTKPIIQFTDVEVSYKSLDSLNFTKASQSVLTLKSKDNNLAFSFRTVDINNPKEVQYRYKLNDNDWSPWSFENKITLANLGYGAYTFNAQSRNIHWKKSEPIHFDFFIEKPIHAKTWFQSLLYSLGGLLLIFLVWRYVSNVKRKSKEVKERLELENHLLSLEQKALRLQMNPHFIFNVLNGIKAMGATDSEKMNHTINKFARLLRATLNNSRASSISLAQEIETLKNYIEVEQIMAPKEFDYKIIDNLGMDAEEVLIPPMLVQPFVENAIKHGIMKGNKKSMLHIHFSIKEQLLCCVVEDNGIGIHESKKNKKATDHQSMALTVTKERIVSLMGKNTLTIEDLGAVDDQTSGTRVYFEIPLVTDY